MAWEEEVAVVGKSFVEYVQIFCGRRATGLKSKALIAYSVHNVQMTFTYSFWRWFIENGHTVVEYLPVGRTVPNKMALVFSEVQRPVRYWFIEDKEIEKEESCAARSKAKTQ